MLTVNGDSGYVVCSVLWEEREVFCPSRGAGEVRLAES